jgi:hypothetical protein
MRKFLLFCIILALAGCGRQSVKVGEQQQKAPKVHFSGGSGDSYEDAVVISGALKQNERLDAEYEYISNKHGLKNRDWSVAGQTIIHEAERFRRNRNQVGSDSERSIYYFDVTSFPWKKE